MDTHEFSLFGRKFDVHVGLTDMNGKHTVTVESRDKFIPHRLQCRVNPAVELIEIYIEHVASKRIKGGHWLLLETAIKFKMSEYHFPALLGKWMALTYLTVEYEIWFKRFIPTVNQQSGYKIYKEFVGTDIVSENIKTGHRVVFMTKSEEDGFRHIAKDNNGQSIEHFAFYNWEFERSCVGIKPS